MDFALYRSRGAEGTEAEECVCVCVCSCQAELFLPDVFLFYSPKRRTVCLSPADTQIENLRDAVMKSFFVFEREDVCVCVIN